MNRKKVAIFLPSLAGGGAEKVMLNIAEWLATENCQVDLLIAHKHGSCKLPQTARINLIDLQAGKPSRAIFKLIKYIWREKPCAIMSAITHANIALAIAHKLSLRSQKCILGEHSHTVAIEKEKHGVDKLITKYAGRICYQWADEIIAVSNGVADSVAKFFSLNRKKITVIYNPVDLDESLLKSKLPVTFPWKDELPIIISVGRLHTQKNYPLLIAAYSAVKKYHPCHLAILGEGEERERIHALIQSLHIEEDVWMPGFLENPQAYVSRSNVFVLSSNYEGLPVALIESLALGVSIISTNCPSGPEEILCKGRYGVLVEQDNIEQLTNAILMALDGISPTFSSYEAMSRFHPKKIVQDYKQALGI